MQNALNELYRYWKKRPKGISDGLLKKLAGPDLIFVADPYVKGGRRVAIIGQQQKGCDYNYKDFLDKWTILEAVSTYEKFYFGKNYTLSPFWQFFREVREHYHGCNCDMGIVAWANLLKFETVDEESILWQDFEEEVLSLQGNIFNEEIKILRPDICIFVTGPNYDRIIQWYFPGVVFEDTELGGRVLSRVVHGELPKYTFRTYHPNPLRRTIRKWRPVLDKIYELA
jgi:hypothetical protein